MGIMTRIAVLIKMIWLLILCQIAFPVIANEDNFSSAYFITREDRQLAGHLVKTIESTSFMHCSHSCLRKTWCTSANFKESVGQDDKGTCELNKHEFAPINADDTKLIDQPGTKFAMMLKGCLMTGCLNGGSCLIDKRKETFTCSCKFPWIGDRCEVKKNWKKINDNAVCFGARNNSYGVFNISQSGLIYTFKLVHLNGSVKCTLNDPASHWGCTLDSYRDQKLFTVITFPNNTALPLAKYRKKSNGCWFYSYQIDGVGVNATELVFNNLPSPMTVSIGQKFRIWYGGDLIDCVEEDNSGETCADVYACYA